MKRYGGNLNAITRKASQSEKVPSERLKISIITKVREE